MDIEYEKAITIGEVLELLQEFDPDDIFLGFIALPYSRLATHLIELDYDKNHPEENVCGYRPFKEGEVDNYKFKIHTTEGTKKYMVKQ